MEASNQAGKLPPQAVVMQMATGLWIAKTIAEISRLDIPDLLQAHGASTAEALVEQHGAKADPAALERALRAVASVGIFSEDANGVFGPTPLSEVLTTDSPVSVKKMVELFCASMYDVWGGLGAAIATGENQSKAQLGMEYWDYLNANPQELEDFGAAMKSNSHASLKGVLEFCDLSGVSSIADVAGGFGHLAIALLKKYPGLRAMVVDMPSLVPIAEKEAAGEAPEVLSRLQFVGGDVFEDVPEAEVYIMKHIIHDWDDARCIQLLRHCHDRMQGDGRVICVDAVLPPMGDTGGVPAKFLDLNMLVTIPGKERTRVEWEELYKATGFTVVSVTPIHDNFGTSIVEGKKA